MVKLRSPGRILIIALIIGIISVELIANLSAAILWFKELGYLSIFLTRLGWQSILFGAITTFSWVFCGRNIAIAQKLSNLSALGETPDAIAQNIKSRFLPFPDFSQDLRPAKTRPLKFPVFLTLIIVINLLIALTIIYYGKVAVSGWISDVNLPNLTPPVISSFNLIFPLHFLKNFQHYLGFVITTFLLLIALIYKPRLSLQIISTLLSLILGIVIANNWTKVLNFLYQIPFNQTDPQFNKDISFYVFSLPFWKILDIWLGGLFLFGLLAVLIIYLQGNNHLSEGKFSGFNAVQLRHLSYLGGLMILTIAFRHWINRYLLLYSPHDVVYGANYTDIHLRLPFETVLALTSLGIAIWFIYQGCYGWQKSSVYDLKKQQKRVYLSVNFFPLYLYLILTILKFSLGIGFERLIVEPNQLNRESPYIERSITATRDAFNLSKIQSQILSGKGKLTQVDLEKNRLTLNNIRLWDPIPLLKTNRQLQQIRLYYKFSDADLDRYTIKIQAPNNFISTTKQQVLISPRELDYSAVPAEAKTWINEHLVYTHGYGFTLSPVNLADEGGLPFYFVKDIATSTEESALRTSSKLIRASVPIGKPRIYFGELTDTYIMTNTKVKEFDFPSGQDNVYNVYDGSGGIPLGNGLNRLLFAIYLKDWQMIFTRNFNPDTQILFRRNINHRIQELAPFLHFDRDPYLVTAKTDLSGKNTLFWIIDAYTTSHYYPYSDAGARDFNYIRNSVKIVVDAYNGNVDFYVIDDQDPIIQNWRRIFPDLFKSFVEMPDALKSHIRYPLDLFSIQSEKLLTYHMTDVKVFYNREDQWQIPQEIYDDKPKPVAPYYLIMKLAGIEDESEEFVLSHVYTPNGRNNLISLLFARSDQQNYGKLLLYILPKEQLIYGPEQIEALINQDPIISERISLWNRKGSRVLQGNLLVIPIEQSLLYVEPLYLEAENNSLPTLARVVVVYENEIAMSETLNGALDAIFSKSKEIPSTILRKLDTIPN